MEKSTFINLLLNPNPKDVMHAQDEAGDRTLLIYEHPKFNTFKLVDFSGFGTHSMPRDRFLHKIHSKNIHYFFIFIDTEFTEEYRWLLSELDNRGVHYSFVRVIVDTARKKGTNEQEEIAQIRRNLVAKMDLHDKLKLSKLFLISNLREYFNCGDLFKLLEHISSSISYYNKEVLLFFLPLLTQELVFLKCNALKKRIKFAAFAAGVLGAIPIPPRDLPVNMKMVMQEVQRYVRILQLDHQYEKVPEYKHPLLKETDPPLDSLRAQFYKSYMKPEVETAVSQLDLVLPGIEPSVVFAARHLNSELEMLRTDAQLLFDNL
ncbi:unnamed protein product [Mytilus edulis]|uniref:IRG-type G domain-containing protein n=1 Tax=Mytilus edulis TaxID=6550 RepID=A0A8S3QF25_MYTED|nr:unnamed protein product [Mytilus edulis]